MRNLCSGLIIIVRMHYIHFIDHQKIEIIPAKFNKLYSVFGDVSIDNERGTRAVVLPYSMPKIRIFK